MAGTAPPAASAGAGAMAGMTPINRTVSRRLGRRRQGRDLAVRVLCGGATLIGLAALASILYTLAARGLGGLSLHVLTTGMRAAGSNGGLANAIVGTLIMTTLAMLIGTPIGLLAGTFLAEYAQTSRVGDAVRFVADMLLSAPSILIGLFVYNLMVVPFGYSGLAGAIALAVIAVPIVVRTTEDMLRLIPVPMREAAVALGAPKWRVIVTICYRGARDGIATGILLAVARVAGETAPLLFTSLGNQNMTLDLRHAMSALPLAINQDAGSSSNDLVQLAWVGALLITAGVLATNVLARLLLRKRD